MSADKFFKSLGVPLAHYRDIHKCCVSVQCETCMRTSYYLAADVIERLNARGIDGGMVGVVELRRYIKAPCKRCGGQRFDTRPQMDMHEPNKTAFWDRREP